MKMVKTTVLFVFLLLTVFFTKIYALCDGACWNRMCSTTATTKVICYTDVQDLGWVEFNCTREQYPSICCAGCYPFGSHTMCPKIIFDSNGAKNKCIEVIQRSKFKTSPDTNAIKAREAKELDQSLKKLPYDFVNNKEITG